MPISSRKHGVKHSVAVSVRIRPGGNSVARTSPGTSVVVNGTNFTFPTAVLEGSDQAIAYQALASSLVRRFCEGGLSCTLAAYGQTGSGKTHTLFGPPGALTEASLEQAHGEIPAPWGVFPRALVELLRAPELAGATFRASAIEVYMEQAYDLLHGRKALKVGAVKGAGRGIIIASDMGKEPVFSGHSVIVGGLHPASCSCRICFAAQTAEAKRKERTASGGGTAPAARKAGVPRAKGALPAADEEQFGTQGETVWPMRDAADVAKLARLVEAERVAHGHALNARSSRSHCLIRVHCTHVDSAGQSQKRLFLFVDLAGSERIAKSGAAGARQKEASNINQSLTTLGRIVKDLTGRKEAKYISYRDSALTMLLRDSFAGSSCTGFVINVAGEEEHTEETLCSLRFGEKLSSVKTSAVASQATDVAARRAQVSAELEAERVKLAELVRAGQGDHINPAAPPSEQASLRNNIATMTKREVEVRALKARLVEAKAAHGADSAAVAAVSSRLEEAMLSHSNIRDIVLRQKTIPGLWVGATAVYSRTEAQVASLCAQMDVLG